jgi:hypothetical protein
VPIAFRADSGFAIPALYEWFDAQDIEYTIGLPTNTRLEALAADLSAEAQAEHAKTGEKVRLAGEGMYAAGSWSKERRVVFKVEMLSKGVNIRYVVTERRESPLAVYDWYVQRGGGPELWIKDLKEACFADRLSCHDFWANQFRLFLHAAAYWLLDTIRRWLMSRRAARIQMDTLRLQLIKIGGWVRHQLDTIRLHLASSHPGEPLWHLLATRPNRQ